MRARQCAAKDKAKIVVPEDIEIPPLLRTLHPMLSCKDYRRYRRDPIFLFKLLRVCEQCYLVYAQVASEMHNANIFTNERNYLISTQAQKHRQEHVRSRARIREHRANAMRNHCDRMRKRGRFATKETPLRNANLLKPISDFKSRSQPSLPPRIDSSNAPKLHLNQPSVSQANGLNLSRGTLSYEDEDSRNEGEAERELADRLMQTLSERENALFRDLYNNPNLDAGHPLRHMIEGEQQFGRISVERTKETREDARPKTTPSPYATALAGKHTVKKKPLRGGSSETSSAGKHRQFLVESMQQVRAEMDRHEDLDRALRLTEVAENAEERLHTGESFNEVWEQRKDVLEEEAGDERSHVAKTALRVDGEAYLANVAVNGRFFEVSLYCPASGVTYRVDGEPVATVADNFPSISDPTELALKLARRVRRKDIEGATQFYLEVDR